MPTPQRSNAPTAARPRKRTQIARGGGGSHGAMVAVNKAYDTLSDPEKKARYDQTGDDSGPTLEQQAVQVVLNLFMQLIDQVGDEHDHVAQALAAIQSETGEMHGHIRKLESRKGIIQRRLKLLKFKGNGRNPIAEGLQQQMASIPAQVQSWRERIKVLETAKVILRDYDWTKPPPAPAQPNGVFTIFMFSGK